MLWSSSILLTISAAVGVNTSSGRSALRPSQPTTGHSLRLPARRSRPSYANGKRLRRRVTAATKTECLEPMSPPRGNPPQAPKSSKTYTVRQAVHDWLAHGLPGRAESTKTGYGYAVAPLVARVGHRPLRELTSSEVRLALAAISGNLSRRSLVIARLCLERAITFAMSHDRVAKNVVSPVEVPEGKVGRQIKGPRPHPGPGAGQGCRGRSATQLHRAIAALRTSDRGGPSASLGPHRPGHRDCGCLAIGTCWWRCQD
jgi:hypothetical protein